MTDNSKITFRMKPKAKALLDMYLELTGLTASEVARAAISDKIMSSPLLVGHVSDILTRTCVDDNTLSKDKGDVRRHNKKGEEYFYFQTFIGNIQNKLFPNRVSKAIKDNWEEIQSSELDPKELAELYDKYCESVPDGQEPSHPNSWIAGHGFLNTKYEKEDDRNYDF